MPDVVDRRRLTVLTISSTALPIAQGLIHLHRVYSASFDTAAEQSIQKLIIPSVAFITIDIDSLLGTSRSPPRSLSALWIDERYSQ